MDEDGVSGRAWIMLLLLGLLYVLSFVDRFILALLVAPLRAELHLSDLQLGLLFGTFFALFYGLVGVPLARVADRGNRKWLIVAGVVVWCGCTIASAFATSYAMLAVLRFGLATGEAALTPAAFSILTDAFPARRRVLANTLFSASGMVGASTSFAIGAGAIMLARPIALEWQVGVWRPTLIAVGLPGLALAVLFAVVAREPGRGADTGARVSLREVWTYLAARRRLFGGLFGGAGAEQTIVYALIGWSPTLLNRQFGMSGPAAGTRLAVAQFVAAVGGTLLVPTLIRQAAGLHAGWAARAVAVAAGTGALLVALATLTTTAGGFIVASAAGSFLLTGVTNAMIILVQPIAPPTMRATFTALLLICISSVGLGLGPPLAAAVAHRAGDGADALGIGLRAVALLGFVGATALFALAARPLALALASLQGGAAAPTARDRTRTA